jgi:hypothetical protein
MTDRQILAEVAALDGNAQPPRRVILKRFQPRSAMEPLEEVEPEEGR